jgi:hypothetical protein
LPGAFHPHLLAKVVAQARALGRIEPAVRLRERGRGPRERGRRDDEGRGEPAVSGKDDGRIHDEILGTRTGGMQRRRGKRCNKG